MTLVGLKVAKIGFSTGYKTARYIISIGFSSFRIYGRHAHRLADRAAFIAGERKIAGNRDGQRCNFHSDMIGIAERVTFPLVTRKVDWLLWGMNGGVFIFPARDSDRHHLDVLPFQ